jgi:hypothetical protein
MATLRLPRRFPAVLCAAGIAASCHGRVGDPAASASDEWTRRYELQPGGELQIENRNGPISLAAVDGDAVDVRVVRTARAATEAAARDLLTKIEIRETVQPAAIRIQTEGVEGLLIGVEWELHYFVRAPRNATVRARARNGAVTAAGFGGRVVLTSTNGNVNATGLSGGAEIRATNGSLDVAVMHLGADLVELRSTNGSARLVLPKDAKATLLASVTNGRIDVDGLTVDPMGEQSPRRVRGRVGGGGTPVDVTVTNGQIAITAAP